MTVIKDKFLDDFNEKENKYDDIMAQSILPEKEYDRYKLRRGSFKRSMDELLDEDEENGEMESRENLRGGWSWRNFESGRQSTNVKDFFKKVQQSTLETDKKEL
jgi:hypothetical protein